MTIQVAIIDPLARTVTRKPLAEVQQANGALCAVPSHANRTDHGTITAADCGRRGICIIVYEFSLFCSDPQYYALAGMLFNGPALLYGYAEDGITVDLPYNHPQPTWIGAPADVELAIDAGLVLRPQSSINGVIHWQWSPQNATETLP